MKPYIEMNTERRKRAATPIEKQITKDMNNHPYGKTCENVRKRMDLKICFGEEAAIKYIEKLNYLTHCEFGPEFYAVHLARKIFTADKPFYIGFSVLEFSKLLMYTLL